jgi:nucleoside-diphosphate-sugar epimerase
MSTYLVTGATGFVGSALVERLVREGHAVRVLAREGQHFSDRSLDVRVASLGDPNAIADAADGVEVIYHCAFETSPAISPTALAWINVAGTENVCNAARHAGVRRVVHLSCTDVTLTNRDRMNWNESRQLDEPALDAVCRTKQLAEELALHRSDHALEVCALRPAWIWGPGDRRALPALCREAARGRVSLCGSGENLLPTVYIENLLDALRIAASSPDVTGRAFHVLDGETLTAREFLDQLCKAVGIAAPSRSVYALSYGAAWLRERFGISGLTRGDVARRGRNALFDGVAAVRELGYQPRVTVEEGMQAVAAWAQRVGGPAGIARLLRAPSDTGEVDGWIRLAESVPSKPS